jgi:hypothetical protein
MALSGHFFDMYRLIAAVVCISMLVSGVAYAAEVDSITTRRVALDNSLQAINRIFEQRIKEGIREANEEQAYLLDMDDTDEIVEEDGVCDEEVLYAELRKAVFQSFTASWGLKGYDLDQQLRELLARQSYSLMLNDSVYRDIGYIEGFSLNLKELTHVVNINGHLIGLDKIGHFFAEGWRYFDMTRGDDHTIEQAIEWGRQKEAGLYGFTTTGIFSYSDLVANFNGWRFWNKVLLKRGDPLKGVLGNFFNRHYVACRIQLVESFKNRKLIKAWEYNARFDLSDYIDGAWDEGNNCNSYADPMIEQKVTERIYEADPDFACPFKTGACSDAQDKYGYYAKYLLNPFCLTAE